MCLGFRVGLILTNMKSAKLVSFSYHLKVKRSGYKSHKKLCNCMLQIDRSVVLIYTPYTFSFLGEYQKHSRLLKAADVSYCYIAFGRAVNAVKAFGIQSSNFDRRQRNCGRVVIATYDDPYELHHH